MADWGDLPGGVVSLLAKRLQLIEDFIAFRSTCSSWRKATSLSDFDKSCPRLPLVLLDYYSYDIDKKFSDYFDRSPSRDRADEFDEDIQIHDHSEDENDEMVADEVNYENVEGYENDGIDESNGDEDNSGIDEESSDTDTDENSCDSEEIKVNTEIIAEEEEVNYQNVKGEQNDEMNKSNGNQENPEIKEVNFDSDEDSEERMFFSLSKGKGCMISLPEARGMECIGSKGWLIMVNRSTGDMCLFHPLTRARITLPEAPPEVKFPIYPKHIRCAVLSASPSETSDYVVMVAYVHQNYISGSCVVFWKPGNLTWTRVELEALARGVEDLTYYNGEFYALTWRSEVWMCDISGPNPENKAIKTIELPWKLSRPGAQLVECGGRLLVVAPFFCYGFGMELYHDLKMVELDVIRGSYSTITSLGSSTVFLGRNEAFAVDVNQFPPGIIEANRIYFSDRSYRIASRGRDNVPRPDLGLGAWGVWINF